MDLRKLFENEKLEFKRELSDKRDFAREIIAFANSRGGDLIIGYDEKAGNVIGVVPDQRLEELISNIIHDFCTPRIDYAVSYETLEAKSLLIVHVREGGEKPYHLKKEGMVNGTFVRVGSTTRIADREVLARLIREGKNISYDMEIIQTTAALSKSRLEEYLKKRTVRLGAKIQSITSTLLEDLFLQRNELPTVAGLLLFADSPQQVPALTNAYIKAARFKGISKGIFLDQREIAGPLPDQIESAANFVLRNISLSGKIQGTKREDEYQYPTDVVREIIVNAVIHRDYSITGSTILLAIYDDRIEITSPGGLAGLVTPENIADRQYNRNPIIAKRMFEMGFFDSWGQGVDSILRWAKLHNLRMPQFIDQSEQFTLVVSHEASEGSSEILKDDEILSDIEQKILRELKRKKRITNRSLQASLDLSKSQAQLALRNLLKYKLVLIHGAGRATFYTSALNTDR